MGLRWRVSQITGIMRPPIVQAQLGLPVPPANTLAIMGWLSILDIPTTVSNISNSGGVEVDVDNASESDSGGPLSETYDPSLKTLNVTVGDELHYEWSGDALGGGSSKLRYFLLPEVLWRKILAAT